MGETQEQQEQRASWWASLEAEQIPELRERILQTAPYFLGVGLLLRLLWLLLYLPDQDMGDPYNVWIPSLSLGVAALGTVLALRQRTPLWSARALFYGELVFTLSWVPSNLSTGLPMMAEDVQTLMLPLVMTCVPVRPSGFFLLSATMGALFFAQRVAVAPELAWQSAPLLLFGLLVGVLAAFSSQLQRRLLASMERQRQQHISRARLLELGERTHLLLGPLMEPVGELEQLFPQTQAQLRHLAEQALGWHQLPQQAQASLEALEGTLHAMHQTLQATSTHLGALQEQTLALHHRARQRFWLPQALEQASLGLGVALEGQQELQDTYAHGDQEKMVRLLRLLLTHLRERGASTVQIAREEAEEGSLRLRLRAATSRSAQRQQPQHFLMARDLAQGIFEGDLLLTEAPEQVQAQLTVALQLEERRQEQAFVPGFQTRRGAYVALQP